MAFQAKSIAYPTTKIITPRALTKIPLPECENCTGGCDWDKDTESCKKTKDQ